MTKEERFRNIAKGISNKDCSKLPELCPDQYVGTIKDIQTDYFSKRTPIFNDGEFSVIEKNIPKAENILILILESPHKDEFYKEDVKDKTGTVIHHKGAPIGPANGTTGCNIREHIAKIFPNFSDYHLILMNAIPFQCSLGVATEHFRDSVFNAAWNTDATGKDFFEDRLKKLLDQLQEKSKNVVIVNACTGAKSNPNEPLCCKVCKSIVSVLENYCNEKECPIEFYHIHHPSAWNQINRTRNEYFWKTDKTAVSPEDKEVVTFDCEKNRWWKKYLDTENLTFSCFGKLEY